MDVCKCIVPSRHGGTLNSPRAESRQMRAFLKHEPQVFRRIHSQILVLEDKARRIADKGMLSIEKKEPEYASKMGFLMRTRANTFWYRSRIISSSYIEEPISCEESFFNGTNSDNCFRELDGPR
ncbi:hypothetical protein TNCV_3748701 [Trichonephila clavipes]|nr:hypothetical protein TNCV_3748701 [Trichonephila clavipes]